MTTTPDRVSVPVEPSDVQRQRVRDMLKGVDKWIFPGGDEPLIDAVTVLLAASPPPPLDADIAGLVSPSDPFVILAGIKQFGLAPDGSDLRDLHIALDRLSADLADAREIIANNAATVARAVDDGRARPLPAPELEDREVAVAICNELYGIGGGYPDRLLAITRHVASARAAGRMEERKTIAAWVDNMDPELADAIERAAHLTPNPTESQKP